MKVTLQHTDTVILSTICKKHYDLTLTMASFVCGISEMIPSVIISSTKYLQIRMKIETVEFLVIYGNSTSIPHPNTKINSSSYSTPD